MPANTSLYDSASGIIIHMYNNKINSYTPDQIRMIYFPNRGA